MLWLSSLTIHCSLLDMTGYYDFKVVTDLTNAYAVLVDFFAAKEEVAKRTLL